jgi:1-acyl-sn-glycerol-3-phosphate acyltransferase
MLKVNKSGWFEKIFSIYNRNLLKRRFHALHFAGFENLNEKSADIPKIIYVNHSSWWDGLVAFQISSLLKLNAFVMMEEKQLKRLSLFRKLGAFSVVRENPFKAIKSINYAADLLKENAKSILWVFPQGEILPNDVRPLKFYSGVSRIIQKVGKCLVYPVALRYEFLGDFKPEIFARVGKPDLISSIKTLSIKNATKNFEDKIILTLEEVRQDILNQNFRSYKNII